MKIADFDETLALDDHLVHGLPKKEIDGLPSTRSIEVDTSQRKFAKREIELTIAKDLEGNASFQAYADRRFPEIVGEDVGSRMLRRRESVKKLTSQWADTSGDGNPGAIAMQRAAVEEFDLDEKALFLPGSKAVNDEARKILVDDGSAYKAFLRAQYNNTQKDLKESGITHLTIFRGESGNEFIEFAERKLSRDALEEMGAHAAFVARHKLQPLSSFTVHKEIARGFPGSGGGTLYTARVEASRVLSTARTGFGCLQEGEAVVLGTDMSMMWSSKVRNASIVRGAINAGIAPEDAKGKLTFGGSLTRLIGLGIQ
tara:strand:+ start:260 stop:1201 length:942 start_codon:yes stop_codon:yes gene_type:complete